MQNSPLVKTAAYGEDPNWGRIITAAGNSDAKEFDMKNLTLKIGGHPVLVNGNLSPKYSEAKGKKEFRKKQSILKSILENLNNRLLS